MRPFDLNASAYVANKYFGRPSSERVVLPQPFADGGIMGGIRAACKSAAICFINMLMAILLATVVLR